MMIEISLAVLVFFPFAAGGIVFLAGCRGRRVEDGEGLIQTTQESGEGLNRAARVLAVSAVAAEFLLTAFLAFLFYQRSRIMFLSLYEETNPAAPALSLFIPEVCGFGLRFGMDGFRLIYACVTAFMWMMATVFSGEYFKEHENVSRFYLFLLMTLGAVMGVFLSADLYTTFIFFEIMSFTSYVWVAQEENGPALRAAAAYLAVAVIGGLVMLMGLFLLYHNLGTLVIDELWEAGAACENKTVLYIAGGCMLFGFGAKAGAFPLHIWLPKAHPAAPAPASALLSGALTKTGIYGVLILSCNLFLYNGAWGKTVFALGIVTMAGGALLAVFSVDLKRTLACSSMSQIGFILTGIGLQGMLGEENALAVHGTLLHMVNHSLIKLALFLAAGAVYMSAHELELNRIRGWGRKKPLAACCFLTGALAIGGVPMFGGYISKTLLHEAILEYGGGGLMTAAEWLFLISGGLTAAYMAKLFAAIFLEKNQDAALQEKYDGQKKYLSRTSSLALGGSALILLVWGLFPHGLMERIAGLGEGFMKLREPGEAVAYFTPGSLKGALISLGIGAAVYLLFVRKVLMKENRYVNRWPDWLDLEERIYRPLLLKILPAILGVLCRIPDCLADTAVVLLRKTVYQDSPLPHERPEGNAFTEALGKIMNGWETLGNHIWRRKAPRRTDYVHILALKNEEIRESNRIIGRSLSFGLLLFGVGLALTLVYLIWW